MCLKIKNYQKDGSHVRIARKDIETFKVLVERNYYQYPVTLFMNHPVDSPVMEERSFSFNRTWSRWEVHRGIHSYTTEKMALGTYRHGLSGRVLHRAIIPKGTKYIVGTNHDIVSLCLIIGERVA